MGPVSVIELKQLAGAGEIQPHDLVWSEGMTDWTPASNVRGLFGPFEEPPATKRARIEGFREGTRLGFANGAAWAVEQITGCDIKTSRKASAIADKVKEITERICYTPDVTPNDERVGIIAVKRAEGKGGEELRELIRGLGTWQKKA